MLTMNMTICMLMHHSEVVQIESDHVAPAYVDSYRLQPLMLTCISIPVNSCRPCRKADREVTPGYTPRLKSDSRVMVLLHPLQSAQLNQHILAGLMMNA